jgi:hypothetical protein
MKTRILHIPENVNSSAGSPLPDAKILKKLKEKFQHSVMAVNPKATILTILPNSWSIWKFQEVLPGASNYMIWTTKQLVMDQGIMSSPSPKPCTTLNKVTLEVVKSFYSHDALRRVMPGKRIKVSGVKIHNKNDCCCMKELYFHFKQTHSGVKVRFLKTEAL